MLSSRLVTHPRPLLRTQAFPLVSQSRSRFLHGTLDHRQIMYDGKIFTSTSNTSNGEVSSATRFHYHQQGNVVWAEYSGGSIVRGSLIATVRSEDGRLDMRYQHVNVNGELMTGQCESRPEKLEDGRLRLHEQWQWTSGDCSKGESVVEEVKQ